MKRRLGSYFYSTKNRPEEDMRKGRSIPHMIKAVLRKTCLVLGGFMLVSIVLSILAGIFAGGAKSLPEDMILTINITDPIGETEHGRSLADPLAAPGTTVQAFIETLDRAAVDPRVHGLLVSLDNGGIDMAHIQEIRTAVKRFRATGKFAHIYTASFADLGSGIGAYYFAAAFDQIWMQPVGLVSMTGLALDMPFGKDALDKIGANPQFLHREEYKSAMESFTNSQMSPANREMMTSILGDLSTQLFNDIAQDRKLTAEALQAQIDKGLIAGEAALKAGLITRLDYADVLVEETREKITGKKDSDKPELVFAEDYHAAMFRNKKADAQANVALVRVAGEIVPGHDAEPGFATGDYIAGAIDEAADNDNIKVIVVRVDSPGGSPSASETIRHAIVHAKEKGKKVIVSMGPVAASGGYWVAVNADKIYALPSTLTGSVGVIMGKFEISGLWKKLGVNWDGVSWGENARLWSINAPMGDSERAALNAAIDSTYADFIDRVAEGRQMDKAKVHSLAKGRAWTGSQAKKNGLVDEIGGLDASMEYAAKLIGEASRSKLKIIELPEPLTPLEQIIHLMDGQISLGRDLSMLKIFEPLMKRVEIIRRGGPVQAYDPDLTAIRP
jgi:protease-4